MTNTSIADTESSETDGDSSNGTTHTPDISPPQKPILVFALVLLTFGVYIFFWYYKHAKDLKHLDKKPTTPWLWVLVPVVPLAVPFATNNMMQRYSALAKANGTNINPLGALLGVLAMLCLVASRMIDRFDPSFEYTMNLLVFLVLAGIFAKWAHSINILKDTLDSNRFRKKAYRTTGLQWVALCLGGLAFGIGALLPFIHEAARSLQPSLPVGQHWRSANGNVSLMIRDDWSEAEIGTHSDGSAMAEFSGSSADLSAILFEQGPSVSFDQVIEDRQLLLAQENQSTQCTERRWLQDGTLFRVSRLACTGNFLGDKEIIISTHVGDEVRHYELLIYAMVSGPRENAIQSQMDRLSEGFSLTRAAP